MQDLIFNPDGSYQPRDATVGIFPNMHDSSQLGTHLCAVGLARAESDSIGSAGFEFERSCTKEIDVSNRRMLAALENQNSGMGH